MDHLNVKSMEKERKAKKKWISELVEEKETREAIDFLHKLDRKDFLFYVQLVKDSHRLTNYLWVFDVILFIYKIDFDAVGTSWRKMAMPQSFMFREKCQI